MIEDKDYEITEQLQTTCQGRDKDRKIDIVLINLQYLPHSDYINITSCGSHVFSMPKEQFVEFFGKAINMWGHES